LQKKKLQDTENSNAEEKNRTSHAGLFRAALYH
jgi:hypothetical protein